MLLWLRFLTEIGEETKEVDGELFQQAEVREAIELMRESAFSEEELAAYEDYWDSVRVERSMISDALETSHAEGDLQARQEIAKSMLAQGFSLEQTKKPRVSRSRPPCDQSRESTNFSRSNGSKSVSFSPVPMNRVGIPSSC